MDIACSSSNSNMNRSITKTVHIVNQTVSWLSKFGTVSTTIEHCKTINKYIFKNSVAVTIWQ